MSKINLISNYFKKYRDAKPNDVAKIFNVSKRYARRVKQSVRSGIPKVLLIDIETSPMEVLVWGLYKQRISPDNIIKEWSILSWAAKWLFDDKIMSDVVTSKEAFNRTDERIIKKLWKLLDEADIIIAHNAKKFDECKMKARFILNDLQPTLPYQVIDTLIESRKHFAFSSHKLDYLNSLFNLTRKIKTSYSLWKRCINNDKTALKEMEEYNKGDIVALEELYLKLRPWMNSHPNIGLYVDGKGKKCARCGSTDLNWKGFYYTPAGRFRSYRCSCGAVGRNRCSDLSKEERNRLTINISR